MDYKRRNLLKMLPLTMLMPGQVLGSITSLGNKISPNFNTLGSDLDESSIEQDIPYKVPKDAMIIDGLLITRGWDANSFNALEKSGYSGFNTSLSSSNLEVALKALNEWRMIITNNPDRLIYAKTAADFTRAKEEEKVAVMFGFQNGTMIEKSIDNLETLYNAGTRWIQLTYNQRNLLGDGCTERTNAGLSDFGIEAVERMNGLGIIVDLSHCGRQTTDDAITFSNPGPCFTHTMCEALYKNHPRAKTDAQIKAMADKGGVIGIICLGYMIGPDPGGATTIETYVDHIEHAIKIGGIDHVGVATDYAIQGIEANGATRENWYTPRLTRFKPSYEVRWPPWIPELDGPERYLKVAQVLDKRGHNTGDIEKILGKNWLRYYNEVLKP